MDPQGVIQGSDPVVGCGFWAVSSVIWTPWGPGGVIQGSKWGFKGGEIPLLAHLDPLGPLPGPPDPPDPLLGCGFWAISSVIWPDMDPQGVIQGSKRGQNGSFWGSQNDPSDRWFWPFSPPKPGQEGSQKGSKKGVKTTPFDPSGTPRPHLKARRSYFWPFLQSFWPPGALGGSFRGPK